MTSSSSARYSLFAVSAVPHHHHLISALLSGCHASRRDRCLSAVNTWLPTYRKFLKKIEEALLWPPSGLPTKKLFKYWLNWLNVVTPPELHTHLCELCFPMHGKKICVRSGSGESSEAGRRRGDTLEGGWGRGQKGHSTLDWLCRCSTALGRNKGKCPERQSSQTPCLGLLEQEQRLFKSWGLAWAKLMQCRLLPCFEAKKRC